jgi:hypothetical protein
MGSCAKRIMSQRTPTVLAALLSAWYRSARSSFNEPGASKVSRVPRKGSKFSARSRHSRALDSDHDVIRLNAEESRALAEALLNPREPNDNLRDAALRYREMIDNK